MTEEQELRYKLLEIIHDMVDANTSARSIVTRAERYLAFVKAEHKQKPVLQLIGS